jgi:RimJ/RimL family protein N-acetyltransferase
MHLPVNDDVYLSDFTPADKAACLTHLADREIYENTLRIPYPYTEADADRWLEITAEAAARGGPPFHWAIREPSGFLIGSCGIGEVVPSHKGEIGYWLARPYWGRGITTAVVRTLVQFAAAELGLVKLTAHVFAHNAASARVLEKNGFAMEGYLKKHHRKDGRFLDSMAYGMILAPAMDRHEA